MSKKKDKPAEIEIDEILDYIKKKQNEKRFHHTLGVAYTATALAMCHDIDLKAAEIAGLLHDVAKPLSDEEELEFCKKHDLAISDLEERNPFLLHGKIGSFMAKDKFGIDDINILNAIHYHTTGRPGMSTLEKIIFISDYIEPSRKVQPNLSEIRKKAFEDLDAALIWILKDTLKYLSEKDGEIDPMTQKTYEYYCKGEENL